MFKRWVEEDRRIKIAGRKESKRVARITGRKRVN